MTAKLSGTLVLVGAGKMGGAMLEGWIKSGIPAKQVAVLDPALNEEARQAFERQGARVNVPVADIKDAEAVIVAVKPQVLESVLPGIASLAASKPMVLSVVAGKTIAAYEKHFGNTAAIIRTMPNTPAAIGRGITAMTFNKNVSESQKALAAELLSSIGEVVTVANESDIDAVTAVSGSGPAYIFYLTECLAKSGEAVGLSPDIAMQLARATVAGAGELMRQSGIEAATLRKNVTSPNGTTQAALEVLMADDGLDPLMRKAVEAACNRSRELAK